MDTQKLIAAAERVRDCRRHLNDVIPFVDRRAEEDARLDLADAQNELDAVVHG